MNGEREGKWRLRKEESKVKRNTQRNEKGENVSLAQASTYVKNWRLWFGPVTLHHNCCFYWFIFVNLLKLNERIHYAPMYFA
jgi:hypothetical protein